MVVAGLTRSRPEGLTRRAEWYCCALRCLRPRNQRSSSVGRLQLLTVHTQYTARYRCAFRTCPGEYGSNCGAWTGARTIGRPSRKELLVDMWRGAATTQHVLLGRTARRRLFQVHPLMVASFRRRSSAFLFTSRKVKRRPWSAVNNKLCLKRQAMVVTSLATRYPLQKARVLRHHADIRRNIPLALR